MEKFLFALKTGVLTGVIATIVFLLILIALNLTVGLELGRTDERSALDVFAAFLIIFDFLVMIALN